MTPRDRESIERLNDWVARTMGHRYPEAEVRATGGVFDSKGRFVQDRVPSGAGRQVLNSVERPDYRSVRVPTLAIYRPMTFRSMYPNAGTFDADDRERAERQLREARVWWQRSIDQYRNETSDGRVVLLESGAHHVFLTNADEVARYVLSFLADLPIP
jgi:hypothetical protein